MTATEDLLAALEACPPCDQRERLIERARSWWFHDFKSKHPTPKMLFVQELFQAAREQGLPSPERTAFLRLAQRTRLGEFDESAEESYEWAASVTDPEVRAIIDVIDKLTVKS